MGSSSVTNHGTQTTPLITHPREESPPNLTTLPLIFIPSEKLAEIPLHASPILLSPAAYPTGPIFLPRSRMADRPSSAQAAVEGT